jgi:pimeloyl-ACP methyl ester carboxylesterase
MGVGALPNGRTMSVRSSDGTRIHTEVFGPEDGYPIVLAHGITCALRVWEHQINDLSRDHRVIAFDHRGHGRSGVPPRRGNYGLNFLADDLEAVLATALRPGERALIAGHSMGGIAIMSWAHHHPDQVGRHADAVALINTTSGDLLRNVKFLRAPQRLSAGRIRAGGALLKTFGAAPLIAVAERPNRRFVKTLAVGPHAEPAVAEFVYQLFVATPPAGRGGWARALVDSVETDHIDLRGLTVPTLVIGSVQDRLLPIVASRRIAAHLPNLAGLVELPGGHCAILERPAEVNQQLRDLVDRVADRRASS